MPRKKNIDSEKEEQKTKKAVESKAKSSTTQKSKVSTKSNTASKKPTSSKKVADKKVIDKNKDKNKVTTKKVASKKTTTRKTASKKATTKKITTKKPKIEVVEYYDLPYRYNQTIVRVLYQTPSILFIYWDISDSDREKFINQFGENFFNDTIPVLIVHNDTLHYSFEIEIDDFANNWYLHVSDSNCKYAVELGRRPKANRNIDIPNNYLYVTYSNNIEAPNDHILFDKNLDFVYFKDVKTNLITKQAITSLSFMRMMGKIYSLYDLQTNFNKNSWLDNKYFKLDLNNPSSANPSSTFK